MNQSRLAFLFLALTRIALPQTADHVTAEREVRDTISRYFAAWQDGNRETLSSLTRPSSTRFSSGATRLGNLFGRPTGDNRKIAHFIRHLEFLRPDVAVAVGLWRDTTPGAAYASGAFNYTLVREGQSWNLATVHETLNQPLPVLDNSAPEEPLKKDGDWEILFDGQSAGHWVTLTGARDLGQSWRVADGCLISVSGSQGADLRSDREYRSFEMRWEWMASARSNSGVKYRLFGADTISFGPARYAAGWEYQMADDAGDPGARVDDRQKSGALYGVVPVSKAAARPAGEWNESRLLVMDDHVEHWLNGVMTARYPVDFAFDSPVLLQHHASEVRYRNIRLRRILPD
jgi:hypothetical protein